MDVNITEKMCKKTYFALINIKILRNVTLGQRKVTSVYGKYFSRLTFLESF